MQTEKVLIVVPYMPGEEQKVAKLGRLLEKRAGVPVQIKTVPGHLNGWIGTHNYVATTETFDWYVYCPSDYFPGRDYIKLALQKAKETGKRLIGFNDGKWHGANATAGMIHSSLIPEMYGGPLFYPGYEHHGSDPDLTEKAMLMNEFAYAENAILIEIDYEKDFIPSSKRLNQKDVALFTTRKQRGFPND